MYLMYVDECGDCGLGPGSSDFFILSAVVLHESAWIPLMRKLADHRRTAQRKYKLPSDAELHASKMIGRSGKAYSGIGKLDRLLLLRSLLQLEASFSEMRIINVLIDKRSKGYGYDVFERAWDALINRFESTIEHGNFPHPDTADTRECGLVIVDETDERKLRNLMRRMRHNNSIPSMINRGTTIQHNLEYVIEDPFHKKSDTSMLIQACDINSYFLMQYVKPNETIRRHKATTWFKLLDPVLLKQAHPKDEYGIVRL